MFWNVIYPVELPEHVSHILKYGICFNQWYQSILYLFLDHERYKSTNHVMKSKKIQCSHFFIWILFFMQLCSSNHVRGRKFINSWSFRTYGLYIRKVDMTSSSTVYYNYFYGLTMRKIKRALCLPTKWDGLASDFSLKFLVSAPTACGPHAPRGYQLSSGSIPHTAIK